MEDLQKSIRINFLFDIYGTLLTKTQQKMIMLYYQDDLSLGEIAELEGVSRNAVFDSLKKGSKLLEKYESELHILAREEKMITLFEELRKEGLTPHEEEMLKRIEDKERE